MLASDIISDARAELRDAEAPYRWEAETMLRFVSEGQIEIAGRRPDSLYVSSVTTTAPDSLTDDDATLVINETFRSALVCYVCYRALTMDTEYASNREAANGYKLDFVGLLT